MLLLLVVAAVLLAVCSSGAISGQQNDGCKSDLQASSFGSLPSSRSCSWNACHVVVHLDVPPCSRAAANPQVNTNQHSE